MTYVSDFCFWLESVPVVLFCLCVFAFVFVCFVGEKASISNKKNSWLVQEALEAFCRGYLFFELDLESRSRVRISSRGPVSFHSGLLAVSFQRLALLEFSCHLLVRVMLHIFTTHSLKIT